MSSKGLVQLHLLKSWNQGYNFTSWANYMSRGSLQYVIQDMFFTNQLFFMHIPMNYSATSSFTRESRVISQGNSITYDNPCGELWCEILLLCNIKRFATQYGISECRNIWIKGYVLQMILERCNTLLKSNLGCSDISLVIV